MVRNMEGRIYRHPKLGDVRVIIQPNYKAGGPRNVLVNCMEDGHRVVVPQRSLRKIRKEDKP